MNGTEILLYLFMYENKRNVIFGKMILPKLLKFIGILFSTKYIFFKMPLIIRRYKELLIPKSLISAEMINIIGLKNPTLLVYKSGYAKKWSTSI